MELDALGLASLVVGLIALAIAIYAIRLRRPLYVASSMSLGGVAHPKIAITYDGRPVPNVHSLRVVFWNAGRKEIRSGDIPSGRAGPTINLPNAGEVLSVDCECSNRGYAKLEPLDGDELALKFEYLNRGDAMTCEILCTTVDDAELIFAFSGSIVGAKVRRGSPTTAEFLDYVTSCTLTALSTVAAVFFVHDLPEIISDQAWLLAGFQVVATLILVSMAMFFGILTYRQFRWGLPSACGDFLHRPLRPKE